MREPAEAIPGGASRVHLGPPLPYREFGQPGWPAANLVLTDSGGLQEEEPALGKPVLVLREKTERPEGVAAGTVRLAGDLAGRLSLHEAERLLADPKEYGKMGQGGETPLRRWESSRKDPPLALLHHFGLGERPADFCPGEEG